MADTSPGFKFEGLYNNREALPRVQTFPFATSEDLTEGDMANLESGEVDLGASNDAAFLGAVQETKTGVASTTEIQVITDPDAVYSVFDENARLAGANIDLTGATGQQTVEADNDSDFVVVANSTATERTLVMITHGEHAFN